MEGLKQAAHAKKQNHDDVSQKWADAKKHEEQLKKAKWKSVQALRKKLHTIQSAINMSMDGTEEDEVDSLMQICNMCHDICPTEFRTSMQHMEERLSVGRGENEADGHTRPRGRGRVDAGRGSRQRSASAFGKHLAHQRPTVGKK